MCKLTNRNSVGSYLFARISNDGTDSRFDRIRTKPARFSVAFFLQAMWVSLLLIPVMAINAVPAAAFATLPRLVVTDVVGIGAWAFGMTYESLADAQKSRWMSEKKNKVHDEEFLAKGLFSRRYVLPCHRALPPHLYNRNATRHHVHYISQQLVEADHV